MSSYNSYAQVQVTNNTLGNAIICFSHQYSSDSPQVYDVQAPVAPGANTGTLTVGYNTGFLRTGMDYWFCGVQVLDGPNAGTYATEGSLDAPQKECLLESADSGAKLTFSITNEVFSMQLISGSCSTGVSAAAAEAALAKKAPKLAVGA